MRVECWHVLRKFSFQFNRFVCPSDCLSVHYTLPGISVPQSVYKKVTLNSFGAVNHSVVSIFNFKIPSHLSILYKHNIMHIELAPANCREYFVKTFHFIWFVVVVTNVGFKFEFHIEISRLTKWFHATLIAIRHGFCFWDLLTPSSLDWICVLSWNQVEG